MTKFKKNTHLSLSLLVDLSMHFDFPERMCMYQSLSFFLYLHLQKRFGSRSDPIEFRKECFVNLKMCACDRKYAKCRTKADAHDKWVFSTLNKCIHCPVPCADPEGGQGVRIHPLKNHKNIEFLSNTGPDPLEFSKLPSQHSTLGHHRQASETPFKGVSLAGR